MSCTFLKKNFTKLRRHLYVKITFISRSEHTAAVENFTFTSFAELLKTPAPIITQISASSSDVGFELDGRRFW